MTKLRPAEVQGGGGGGGAERAHPHIPPVMPWTSTEEWFKAHPGEGGR